MAVYTPVDAQALQALLDGLGMAALTSHQGIAAGIENSNYFVDLDDGSRHVLTLFERIEPDELRPYLELLRHLGQAGLPVPVPQADRQGRLWFELAGKPAALLTRLPGAHQLAPDLHHCEQVGAVLARLHLAAKGLEGVHDHQRGLAWWLATAPEVLPHLDAGRAALLRSELAFQQQMAASDAAAELPRGPIHADLFRDNVLFDGLPGHEKLTGLLDFFFAGVDSWLFDLAVCLNDWCCDLDSGRLDEQRAAALVAAYGRERELLPVELRLMPAMLRAAALRFWLSRLWDLQQPRQAEMLAAHDPSHFERVLRERIASPWHPPSS